jgi:hypothetical protein
MLFFVEEKEKKKRREDRLSYYNLNITNEFTNMY